MTVASAADTMVGNPMSVHPRDSVAMDEYGDTERLGHSPTGLEPAPYRKGWQSATRSQHARFTHSPS